MSRGKQSEHEANEATQVPEPAISEYAMAQPSSSSSSTTSSLPARRTPERVDLEYTPCPPPKALVLHDVLQQLSDFPIACVKYNSSIGSAGQNFSHYDAQISVQAKEFCVHVQKPGADGATKLYKSSGSCELTDIKGFVFGPFQSRFWMLRKHINSSDPVDMPFFAWECITISTASRDTDFVVKNERDMLNLLALLIFSLESNDGTRGSAAARL